MIHKSKDDLFHIFDPYGFPAKRKNNAGWVRFKDVNRMKHGLRRLVKDGGEGYNFYNFEVTSIKKAPKDVALKTRMEEYDLLYSHRKERAGK